MKDDNRILDCGHKPSAHSEHTTGTAHTHDGREICWECAFMNELLSMRDSGKCFAYLSSDGRQITNWTGKVIAPECYKLKTMRDNFGGERTYLRFFFEGDIWSGFGMGNGMYLRARKTKLNNIRD